MARYRPEHKEATRRRMIETASRRFKSDGIDGSGIATLVADAGLTNGAFYGHFASKDELIAAVLSQQFEVQVGVVNDLPPGLASVEEYLRRYLSPAHRDDLAGGCPSAALLDEIGRCDQSVREAYTDGASALIAAMSSMRLLVVCASPPNISFSWPFQRSTAPHPPGPGLPEHAPSVNA